MKFLLICVAVLTAIVLLLGSTIINQKNCYDTAQVTVSEIKSNILMRNWSPQQVCETRFTVLYTLNTCIQNSAGTDTLSTFKKTMTDFIIPYIRPLTSTVKNQQAEHDFECSEFKILQFSGSL